MRKNSLSYSLRARLIFWALCVALVLVADKEAHSQQLKKGFMPVAPDVLLKVLPKDVKGWELKRSNGRLDIGIWMESEASREFEMDIQRRYGKEGEPLFTKISIKDTAKVKGGELDLFNDFKPEKFPKEGYEYLYLGGFPAIVVNYKSKGIEAQFLINDRFILTIVLRGQPYKNLKNWFDLVKFSALKNIPDGLKVSVPDEFTVIEIDELNSSKSRRYNSSASLPEVVDDEIKAANSDEGADNKD